MVKVPLEDNFADILHKAQRGLRLSDPDLTRLAGISLGELQQLRDGEVLEGPLRAAARALGLGERTLLELARKAWTPEPVEIAGLAHFNTRLADMTVNSFLVWEVTTRDAVAFDTGANAFGLMATVRTQNLRLKHLLLTHTHGDHVADLERVASGCTGGVWVSEKEPFPGAQTFQEGKVFEAGCLRIETRSTTGHSTGGTTYVVHGLSRLLAVVGDALFAASMGGGKISYADALATNRRHILSLPADTVLCPGHGPLTTVGEEQRHNPFFPEYQQ